MELVNIASDVEALQTLKTELQRPRKTEIGDLTRNGDWYTGLGYEVPNKNGYQRFFEHKDVPNLDYSAGEGVKYVSDMRSLIIGILLEKGYQLKLTFLHPGENMTETRGSLTQSRPDAHLVRLHNDDKIKQAWYRHVVIGDDNNTLTIPVANLVSCVAYLSPLHLTPKMSHEQKIENSVAWMEVLFTDDLITINTHIRVIHAIHQLVSTNQWRPTADFVESSRNVGLNEVARMAFAGDSNTYVVKNRQDLIDVLYAQKLAYGTRKLFNSCTDINASVNEWLVTIDKRNDSYHHTKVADSMGFIMAMLRGQAPDAFAEWDEDRRRD